MYTCMEDPYIVEVEAYCRVSSQDMFVSKVICFPDGRIFGES